MISDDCDQDSTRKCMVPGIQRVSHKCQLLSLLLLQLSVIALVITLMSLSKNSPGWPRSLSQALFGGAAAWGRMPPGEDKESESQEIKQNLPSGMERVISQSGLRPAELIAMQLGS